MFVNKRQASESFLFVISSRLKLCAVPTGRTKKSADPRNAKTSFEIQNEKLLRKFPSQILPKLAKFMHGIEIQQSRSGKRENISRETSALTLIRRD